MQMDKYWRYQSASPQIIGARLSSDPFHAQIPTQRAYIIQNHSHIRSRRARVQKKDWEIFKIRKPFRNRGFETDWEMWKIDWTVFEIELLTDSTLLTNVLLKQQEN